MRIVSLLPSATEIVCALGLEQSLVAVTHECDYPAAVHALPRVTRSRLGVTDQWSSEEIDHRVSRQLRDNLTLYDIDHQLLEALRPDLIITQSLCAVCAVEYSTFERAVGGAPAPRVLALAPRTLRDIAASMVAVGSVLAVEQRARQLAAEFEARIERVRERAAGRRRPRVAFLEWLDPAFGPGHWMPELIEAAGGLAGFGRAGEAARRVPWDDVIAFAPEVIVAAPCGFTLARTVAEAQELLPRRAGWHALPAVRRGRVFLADGSAYFSRPGPRIAAGLELLAELLQPDLFAGCAPELAWAPLGATPTAARMWN
jgi:iron complex transport system substrate-binding protein